MRLKLKIFKFHNKKSKKQTIKRIWVLLFIFFLSSCLLVLLSIDIQDYVKKITELKTKTNEQEKCTYKKIFCPDGKSIIIKPPECIVSQCDVTLEEVIEEELNSEWQNHINQSGYSFMYPKIYDNFNFVDVSWETSIQTIRTAFCERCTNITLGIANRFLEIDSNYGTRSIVEKKYGTSFEKNSIIYDSISNDKRSLIKILENGTILRISHTANDPVFERIVDSIKSVPVYKFTDFQMVTYENDETGLQIKYPDIFKKKEVVKSQENAVSLDSEIFGDIFLTFYNKPLNLVINKGDVGYIESTVINNKEWYIGVYGDVGHFSKRYSTNHNGFGINISFNFDSNRDAQNVYTANQEFIDFIMNNIVLFP